jgi:hypothetical protein
MNQDRCHALDAEAWASQYRDPQRSAALGHALVEAAAGDPAWQGRGWFHVALVHARLGQREAGAASLEQLRAAVRVAREELLAALCREVRAHWKRVERRQAQALELLEPNLAMSDAAAGCPRASTA